MSIEPRRGCGFRKVGGIYLVGDFQGAPCCKMPIPLTVCPCCGAGIKQARGWSWIDPRPFLANQCTAERPGCPAADPAQFGERVGLIWIGEKFYPTVEHFTREAARLGISRRVAALPRGFKLGESWVWLAHPKACAPATPAQLECPPSERRPGVFYVWRPRAVEKIVTQTQARDTVEMEKLAKAGITPVVVPDNDPDHQGSVYDDEPEGAGDSP